MGLHVWRALGLWTHPGPAVSMLSCPLSFVCEMAVRRPACKSCCEERGQSWQQKNVKPRCVSGMQSSGRKGREEHGAAWQWVRIMSPQGHGALASWDNWSLEEDSLTSASAPSQAGLTEWQEVRGIV